MKKVNQIINLLLALFFAVSLVFFLAFDSLKSGFGMNELVPSTVVTFLVIGLVIFLASWATNSMVISNVNKQLEKKEVEKNELKARLYDTEQGIKLKNIETKMDQTEEEKESSVIKPRQNFR